jgi:hypothetical protein
MTDEEITKLLFCCDEPYPADVAMVFGAAKELDLGRRTIRGVELYRMAALCRTTNLPSRCDGTGCSRSSVKYSEQ